MRSGPLPASLRLALAAPLLLAAPAAAQGKPPSDAELVKAWERLGPDERFEVAEWFRAEARSLEVLSAKLLRFVLEGVEEDPGLWPAAERPEPFDPERHAPAQPIARRWLAAEDPRTERLHERVFFRVPERRLRSAWAYDQAKGAVVRTGEREDPERVFRNALNGWLPDHDLAEALVERALDDGALRVHAEAFGHAYTDRAGRAYPGVTLYDAWAAGAEIEMPDVDCLGIVHTVLDDWRTWKAPVPARRHDELYGRIEELFEELHRHRGLRAALARCYLASDPVLRDGYAGGLDRLHALWDSRRSDPAELAGELPPPRTWKAFLDAWAERCRKEPELLATGRERRKHLAAAEREVRGMLVSILRRFGALEEGGR